MEEGVAQGAGAVKKAVVAITGASGVIYGVRTAQALKERGFDVDVVVSFEAEKVSIYECGESLFEMLKGFRVYRENEIEAPPSSSSYLAKTVGVVVSPCSTKTLALIAHGIAQDLISRAALAALRIKKRLVLVIRETPLGEIELENALKVARAGGIILPASPGFYNNPKGLRDVINFIVGKTLDALGVENDLYRRWEGVRTDRGLCERL
ncbi:MAG: UbiX family flavin prenyltransferase [Sulfolobaceae archaeon]|nr:UbiX family flavin prenyltransferase [Sulfolobales archaeon]